MSTTSSKRRSLMMLSFFVLASFSALFAPADGVKAIGNEAKTGYPNSMAALGDSITQAFLTNGDINDPDDPENSWSTGNSNNVNSHYRRILAANGAIPGKNSNFAASGHKMADLNGQVANVNTLPVKAEYVTILMGGNDLCVSSEAAMTGVTDFRTQFETAMQTLSTGSPDARIFVASIPSPYKLWELLKDNANARQIWAFADICRVMLANPESMAQEDVERRNRVNQRNINYNTQLKEVCAQYIHCRWDNNKNFVSELATEDFGFDYYHPSIVGQNKLANVTYQNTFDFTDLSAPISSVVSSPVAGGISLSISATDPQGVAGIEYRLNGGNWTRYTAPLSLTTASTVVYRAVDVNGNIEAARAATLVTSPTDTGNLATVGTLSHALSNASTLPTSIYFAVASNTINVSSNWSPDVPLDTSIEGGCSNDGPTLTINGSNLGQGKDGLSLKGRVTLKGVAVQSFGGKQIVSDGTGNRLSCVVARKNGV